MAAFNWSSVILLTVHMQVFFCFVIFFRRDFYAICQEAGLGSLAAKFGLTPEQFGENLRDSYQRHETTQHTAEPEDAAQDYIRPSG